MICDLQKPDNLLGRIGALETRLASDLEEIKTAQRLRYQVFYQEMTAKQTLRSLFTRRDCDRHDTYCDHLLVIDNSDKPAPAIVGTQRLFVRSGKFRDVGFHSQNEFDLEGLKQKHPGKCFMELGRACIHRDYRNSRAAELLWLGTWAHALKRGVDVMVGCASFESQNMGQIAPALGFLAGCPTASGAWAVTATGKTTLKLAEFSNHVKNPKQAMRRLPPLIRAYLNVGAMFSSEAVADPEFGTIDVLVVLPVEHIKPKYVDYYGARVQQ